MDSNNIKNIKEELKLNLLTLAHKNFRVEKSSEIFTIIDNSFFLIEILPDRALRLLHKKGDTAFGYSAATNSTDAIKFDWGERNREGNTISVNLFVNVNGLYGGGYVHEYFWQEMSFFSILKGVDPILNKSSIEWHEGLLAWWGIY